MGEVIKSFFYAVIVWGIFMGVLEFLWERLNLPFHLPLVFFVLFMIAQLSVTTIVWFAKERHIKKKLL